MSTKISYNLWPLVRELRVGGAVREGKAYNVKFFRMQMPDRRWSSLVRAGTAEKRKVRSIKFITTFWKTTPRCRRRNVPKANSFVTKIFDAGITRILNIKYNLWPNN